MADSHWESSVGKCRVSKVIQSKGSGVTSPQDGSICCISIQLLHQIPNDYRPEMTITECEHGTLELGEGSSSTDIALEYCIQLMKAGESCNVTIAEDNVKCESRFYVALHSFTEAPKIWELTSLQKFSRAEQLKAQGVKFFNEQKLECAFGKFSKAVKILVTIDAKSDDDIAQKCRTLQRTCYLNIAACQLRRQKYNHVVTNCDKVLRADPNNTKALYRRGTALVHLHEYERAKEDLVKVLQLEGHNLPARLQMSDLKEKMELENERYKSVWKKMFNSY